MGAVNYLQVKLYCKDCDEYHWGNCPKIKVTITTSDPPQTKQTKGDTNNETTM